MPRTYALYLSHLSTLIARGNISGTDAVASLGAVTVSAMPHRAALCKAFGIIASDASCTGIIVSLALAAALAALIPLGVYGNVRYGDKFWPWYDAHIETPFFTALPFLRGRKWEERQAKLAAALTAIAERRRQAAAAAAANGGFGAANDAGCREPVSFGPKAEAVHQRSEPLDDNLPVSRPRSALSFSAPTAPAVVVASPIAGRIVAPTSGMTPAAVALRIHNDAASVSTATASGGGVGGLNPLQGRPPARSCSPA
jgi:hypothetical protein